MTVLARVTMPLTLMSLLMSLGSRSRMTLDSARLNVFSCKVEGQATCSVAAQVPAAAPSVHWTHPPDWCDRGLGAKSAAWPSASALNMAPAIRWIGKDSR